MQKCPGTTEEEAMANQATRQRIASTEEIKMW